MKRSISTEWRNKNPEKHKAWNRKYYQKNAVKIREYAKEYGRRYWREKEKKLIEILGGFRCVCNGTTWRCWHQGKCNITDERILQKDHINGNGYMHNHTQFKRAHQRTMLKYYISNPKIAKKELQVLCANCNWIKRVELKEDRRH